MERLPVQEGLDQRLDAALAGDLATLEGLAADRPDDMASNAHLAAASGEPDRLAQILTQHPDAVTERAGRRSWPALLYACFSGLLREAERAEPVREAARLLLKAGADPNAIGQGEFGRCTPLYGAAGIAGDAALTRLLLDHGADPDERNEDDVLGPEALYHAAEHRRFDALRHLLAARPRPDRVSYCFARKLDFDDLEGARLFLEHGADPNFRSPFGSRLTRLHHAIARGRDAATVALLLDHGADPALRTDEGHSALALAVRLGRSPVAELLSRRGADPDTITRLDRFLGACMRGAAADARSHLAADPRLTKTMSPNDQALLPLAALEGRSDAVQLMLDLGFDIEARGDIGSALNTAAWRGHRDTVAVLVARGANLEALNSHGGTPLDAACFGARHCHDPEGGMVAHGRPSDVRHGDYPGTVAVLLEAGADPTTIDHAATGHDVIDALLARARA